MFSFLNNKDKEARYQTNNNYKGYPALMHDSRALIASWQPESSLNNHIIKEQKIKSNWEYRKYLQENATEIIKYNMEEACNDTGYLIPHLGIKPTTPAFYHSLQEPAVNTSDLKQIYLTKEQLEARKISPSITQSQLIQSWGSFSVSKP